MLRIITLLTLLTTAFSPLFADDYEIPSGLYALEDLAQEILGAFRLGGGAGYTFENENDSWKDRLSYGGSIQGIWAFGNRLIYIGGGLEAAYCHLYRETSEDDAQVHSYQAIHAVAELYIYSITFQLGGGPQYYHGNKSEITGGMFVSVGLNFAVYDTDTQFITIPIMIRSQFVFTKGTTISVGIYTGLTFYLCGDY